MDRWLEKTGQWCAWVGRLGAWTVPVLVISVCVSVWLAQIRANVLLEWSVSLPLFGTKLSLNGLNDLQWHLFAIMVMLGGVYTLHERGHVCVDFAVSRCSANTRRWLTVAGDLLLLLPFAAIMTWFSWQCMLAALSSSEGSSYGGLDDRWIIKAVMPLGFGLLTMYALVRPLRLIMAPASMDRH